jgi:hypothetical protein
MPWLETDPMLERHHFVQDFDSGHWKVTELCVHYGISRVPATSGSTAIVRVEWVACTIKVGPPNRALTRLRPSSSI